MKFRFVGFVFREKSMYGEWVCVLFEFFFFFVEDVKGFGSWTGGFGFVRFIVFFLFRSKIFE